MDIEQQVARHYSRANLEQAILDALKAAGKDIDSLVASDLSGADEFHLGWRAATVELADNLGLEPGMRVLDLGSGVGGPARYFAEQHGCQVAGVDLSSDFVQAANALTKRCGLDHRVAFRQASALDLPFETASFDRGTLIHVGMNIQDKAALFAEARRVLKPDGLLGVYEVMRTGSAPLPYPMPWSETEETSFVENAETYRALFTAAGFTIERETDRSAMTLTLWQQMQENVARHGAPPLSLHILMGPATPQRLGNIRAALEQGIVAPVEMVGRAV